MNNNEYIIVMTQAFQGFYNGYSYKSDEVRWYSKEFTFKLGKKTVCGICSPKKNILRNKYSLKYFEFMDTIFDGINYFDERDEAKAVATQFLEKFVNQLVPNIVYGERSMYTGKMDSALMVKISETRYPGPSDSLLFIDYRNNSLIIKPFQPEGSSRGKIKNKFSRKKYDMSKTYSLEDWDKIIEVITDYLMLVQSKYHQVA